MLFIYLFIFCFTILYWFCHTLTWIHHRLYMSSQPWAPLPPPSPYHLSGSSQYTSPSILYPVSNLGWRFVSYMIVNMFQCHSPKSSHHLPLPQNYWLKLTDLRHDHGSDNPLTILAWPCRDRKLPCLTWRRNRRWKFDVTQEWGRRCSPPPSNFFFDYKTVAH